MRNRIMNTDRNKYFVILLSLVMTASLPHAQAQLHYWSGLSAGFGQGSSDIWDTETANWKSTPTLGEPQITWTNGLSAVFGGFTGSTVGTVTLGTNISLNNLYLRDDSILNLGGFELTVTNDIQGVNPVDNLNPNFRSATISNGLLTVGGTAAQIWEPGSGQNMTVGANMRLDQDLEIQRINSLSSGGTHLISGAISGTGGFTVSSYRTFTGDGSNNAPITVKFGGTNIYSGNTLVYRSGSKIAEIELTANNALSPDSAITLRTDGSTGNGAGANLNIGSYQTLFGGLSAHDLNGGTLIIDVNGASAGKMTLSTGGTANLDYINLTITTNAPPSLSSYTLLDCSAGTMTGAFGYTNGIPEGYILDITANSVLLRYPDPKGTVIMLQ